MLKRVAAALFGLALILAFAGSARANENIFCTPNLTNSDNWLPCPWGTSGTMTNPSSTLTLPSSTTAYTAGQLIANSATAASVVVPSFTIQTSAGGAYITRLRLSTNDSTSTAWGGQQIRIDLWDAAPTWTNGDRAAWSPATGTAHHLGSFTLTMSAEYGDGAYGEAAPDVGNVAAPVLSSGQTIYWSLDAVTGSGTTGASKVFTLKAELSN